MKQKSRHSPAALLVGVPCRDSLSASASPPSAAIPVMACRAPGGNDAISERLLVDHDITTSRLSFYHRQVHLEARLCSGANSRAVVRIHPVALAIGAYLIRVSGAAS